MDQTSKISVVVPAFNAARFLPSTLRSVLGQQGVELQVIVVDDGSTDGTADLLEREFPCVELVRQTDSGVAAARNAGIAHARHRWIAFIDADDIWLAGKLRAQWGAAKADGKARMTYTAWQEWASDALVPDTEFVGALSARADDEARWAEPSGWIYTRLLLSCEVWKSTVMMHRSLLDQTGAFDPDLRIGEDYDLWLRALQATPILRLSRPYALYRLHPPSITQRPHHRNYKAEVICRALTRWGYRSPDGTDADRRAVDRALSECWAEFGYAHLRAGDAARAKTAAAEATRLRPTSRLGWKPWASAVAASMIARRPQRA